MNKLQRFNCRQNNWGNLNLKWPITLFLILFCIPIMFGQQTSLTEILSTYEVPKLETTETNNLTSCKHHKGHAHGSHHVTTEEMKEEAFKLMQPYVQQTLANAVALAKKNPQAFLNPPATCFSPDTDPAVITAFYDRRNAIMNGLDLPSEADFTLTTRWLATATDGAGLAQGDLTTLTWSYVPDGTTIGNSGCQLPDAGTFSSDFIVFFNGVFGAPTTAGDFTTAPWHNIFVNMFASWSSVTGLTFVYEPNDDGATNCLTANPGILGTRGDMRISGHLIDGNSGVLACNYFPTSSGDMIIDTGDNYYSLNPTTGTTNVLTHEVGHGLGLRHVCPVSTSKLMEPFVTTVFTGPQEDDILAVNRHYGDADEENNTTAGATALGAGALPTSYSKLQRSIDDNGDIDHFSFTVSEAAEVSGVLTPTGSTYLSGPQNADGSCSAGTNFNAMTVADIMFDILDTDGTTVLGTGDANPAGGVETVTDILLPAAGTYFVRVSQQGASVDNVQMYDLNLDLVAAVLPCDIMITGSAATPTSCIGLSDGSITLTATSVDPITYSIAGPDAPAPVVTNTTGIFPGLAPGNYTARAELTGDPTCSEVVSIEVLDDACDVSIDGAVVTAPSCPGADDGSVVVTSSACGSSINFSTLGSFTVTLVTPPPAINISRINRSPTTFSGLAPGSYPVRLENDADPTCFVTTMVVIPEAACDISIDGVTVVDESCDGAMDGSITAVASHCGTFTYTLTGPNGPAVVDSNATGVFTGLDDGTYVVTATSDADPTCTTMVSAEVMPGGDLVVSCTNITDQLLTCRADLPPVDFDLPVIIESCGDPILSALTIIPGNTGCPTDPLIVTRTYFIQDAAGNMEECMQTFTIRSDNGPTITFCPASVTVPCGSDTAPATLGTATATQECTFTAPVTVTFVDITTPGACLAESTIARTWTATDDCGRTTTCLQNITIVDDASPVLTIPGDVVAECDDDFSPTVAGAGLATATDNCSTFTITSADVIVPGGTCPQIFMIERTWTATDACGETTQDVQMITINDSDAPTITCPPNTTISCEEDRTTGALGFATATDNCDADVDITFSDNFVAGACPQAGILTRTWTATDDCGLTTTCDQIITITDNVNPIIVTCPSNMNIECDQPTTPDFTGRPVATDNCDLDLTSTFSDVTTPGVCDQEMTITRTWTVTDDCGNTATCVQTLNITDETAPIITCPASIIVECDQNTAPGNVMTGMATATNAANLTWGDGTSGPIGSISLAAAGAPAGAVVTNVTIQMDIDHSFTADLELDLEGPDGTVVTLVTDQCGGANNVSATFTDAGAALACAATGAGTDVGTPDDCSNDYLAGATISGMVLPEGTLADFNGTDPNGTWLLNVVDDAGGDGGCVINVNLVVSWSFTAAGAGVTGVATAVDNCDPMPVITSSDFIIPGDCVNEFTIERTWVATDNCGNSSSCTQTIFVQDTTDPVITCPADVTIECDVDRSPATNGTATATDNCTADADIIITFADNIIPGPCANTFTIERTWTATDECELFSTCLQIINVEDTTPPVAPAPPADITVQCPQDIPAPMALTAVDNCAGPITVLPTSEVTNSQCATRFTFTYTWTFDDGCGNVTAISQVIQVVDTAPIMITSSPPDQVVDCQVNVIPQEHLVEAMAPCGNPPTITSSISAPIGTPGCNGTRYIITYTVADDCGRVETTTQTYTIQNEGPEILCGNEVCYLPCSVSGEELLATFNEFADRAVVVDACEESVYTVTNNFNPNSLGECGDVTVVTFTATDACGRTGSCTVPVIVVDDVAPTVTGTVTTAIRECDDLAGLQYISWINNTIADLNATDVCGDVSVSYEPLMPNTTFEDGFPFADTDVTFTFSDECGNDLVVPGLFRLKNNFPPTFIGELEDKMITCPAVPEFDTPVFVHGCGGATLTSSDETSGGSCPGGYTVTRTWTVTDGTGASSTIQQTIFVMGSNTQMSTVAGLIITEMDEPVEDVSVALNYSGTNFAQEEMTAEDGLYNFATPMNNDYEVQPNRNDDPLNGVTTYDLILMGQHILNINPLNSPYQMIAADINKSGSISSLDMIRLRRLILHIDEEFVNNTSWRFVDAAYEFTNTSNPFAETFPESSMINDLAGELASDFIAVKIGDLNNSAQPNQLASGDTRSKDSELVFQLEDQLVEAGETFSVSFDATEFEQILGYQFTLKYNADQVVFEDMEAKELRSLSADNFGIKSEEGVITTSWNRENPLSLAKGSTTFMLTFTALERVRISDVIGLYDAYTPAEAYNASNDLMDVQLRFGEVTTDEKSAFKLFQNQPNPFRTETKIGFQLPEAGTATLVIYDVAGKVLRTTTRDYPSGYNEEVIEQSDLNATGILFYRLETDHGVATKKMILK